MSKIHIANIEHLPDTITPNTIFVKHIENSSEVEICVSDSHSQLKQVTSVDELVSTPNSIIQAITCPEGYLPCDGSIYNKSDYPKLGAVMDDALIITETVPEGSMVLPAGITEAEFRERLHRYEPVGLKLLGTRLFAPFTSGRILYSDDYGTTWLSSQLPGNTGNLSDGYRNAPDNIVKAANGEIVYKSYNSLIYYSLDNGVTWSVSAESRATKHQPHVKDNVFYLFPDVWSTSTTYDDGFYYTSTDCITWTQRVLPVSSNYCVISGKYWLLIIDRRTGKCYVIQNYNISDFPQLTSSDSVGYLIARHLNNGISYFEPGYWYILYNATKCVIIDYLTSVIAPNADAYSPVYYYSVPQSLDSYNTLLYYGAPELDWGYFTVDNGIAVNQYFPNGKDISFERFYNLSSGKKKFNFLRFPKEENKCLYLTGFSFTPMSSELNEANYLVQPDVLAAWGETEITVNNDFIYKTRIGKGVWDTTKFVTPSMFPENGLNFFIKAE